MSRIRLSDERRDRVLAALVALYTDEFDESLSRYRAERVLAVVARELGPAVYNQAVQDARKSMLEKLEDLEGELVLPGEGG